MKLSILFLILSIFTSCSAGYVRHASKGENKKNPARSVLSFLGLDFFIGTHDMIVESQREKDETPWD